MKRTIIIALKLSLIIFLFSAVAVNAQKLPNIQQASIRAPDNVKIDGKPAEWNKFQAYNHATSLYYTMANDDDNLYLTIQANDVDDLTKITGAGIIFNVSIAAKKTDKDAISISYPFFEKNQKPFISFKKLPKIVPGSVASVMKADSFMKMMNKQLDDKSKYIKIIGMPGVDTMISVYNEEGIKAREAFDNTMAYTCELSIPLKYLNLSVNNISKFSYHILLPGVRSEDLGVIAKTGADGSIYISAAPGAANAIPSKDHFAAISATTDFWGEYTLAKK